MGIWYGTVNSDCPTVARRRWAGEMEAYQFFSPRLGWKGGGFGGKAVSPEGTHGWWGRVARTARFCCDGCCGEGGSLALRLLLVHFGAAWGWSRELVKGNRGWGGRWWALEGAGKWLGQLRPPELGTAT
jgi:hypothetical protein